jgi:prolyl 4-hydroxylase
MENQAQQRVQFDPPAAAERVRRQLASLRTSAGWLLQAIEPHAALLPVADAALPVRLRRAARTLSWTSAEQERIAFFAERFAALEDECAPALASPQPDADALGALAVRLEQASAEALAFFTAMQGEAARAAELSRPKADEEDAPPRLRARAEIGAGVRARLAQMGAQKLPAIGLELYRVRDFFDADGCAAIVDLIERDLFPSGTLGRNVPGFRTSKSCNLQPYEPPVAAFETKVSALTGINLRFSEIVQGQRYEVGQEFKPHHDYFHRGESYYEDVTEQGGQRTWTAMLFLNRPDLGGCTGFPKAGLDAHPETGTLLVWNNMAADGRPNPYSMHHGMPVEAGLKYVLTKWFRERPLAF